MRKTDGMEWSVDGWSIIEPRVEWSAVRVQWSEGDGMIEHVSVMYIHCRLKHGLYIFLLRHTLLVQRGKRWRVRRARIEQWICTILNFQIIVLLWSSGMTCASHFSAVAGNVDHAQGPEFDPRWE